MGGGSELNRRGSHPGACRSRRAALGARAVHGVSALVPGHQHRPAGESSSGSSSHSAGPPLAAYARRTCSAGGCVAWTTLAFSEAPVRQGGWGSGHQLARYPVRKVGLRVGLLAVVAHMVGVLGNVGFQVGLSSSRSCGQRQPARCPVRNIGSRVGLLAVVAHTVGVGEVQLVKLASRLSVSCPPGS